MGGRAGAGAGAARWRGDTLARVRYVVGLVSVASPRLWCALRACGVWRVGGHLRVAFWSTQSCRHCPWACFRVSRLLWSGSRGHAPTFVECPVR